ncbi:MAG: homoserine O-acetyltransferase [Verrucomicrobiales bacterium]|nr:homoserine O-acetyltransferase [Verrucomicrobiae bacterium]MCP5555339.1 homoserine O-acetyltransferase [Akkermansiaceae bacterium]
MSDSPGPVETRFAKLVSPGDAPFRLLSGETLHELQLAYETYGQLNDAKDNAVLLFHALSGSHHAAGLNCSVPGIGSLWKEECHIGWWDDFIGPGKALDTDRYFVICANYLGGCYGSTGPASIDSTTGKPWGRRFPHISGNDIVRSQALLLDHLGISCLHAVVGASTGGLLTLNFATTLPERTRRVISIASGGQTTVLNKLFLLEQILAIENDPHFRGGDYYDGPAPLYGLALARMISHKCFVHLDAIERRARQDVVQSDDRFDWYRVRHQVESYMLHQGKKFTGRFDANTYLRICEMWSAYDPLREGGAATMTELLGRSLAHGHHWLVFSIDQDYCFYPEEQASLVRAIKETGVSCVYITVHSDKGHDSFLLEPELYTPHLAHTLQRPG